MDLSITYPAAVWGIAAIVLLLFVQAAVATITKGSKKDAIPGKLNPNLGHESLVFRAHRTFMNTLENSPAMVTSAFLAVLVGANPYWTGLLIWVWVVARLLHMALYYAIATERNPSPRSYFYVLGVLANFGLFGLCIAALL